MSKRPFFALSALAPLAVAAACSSDPSGTSPATSPQPAAPFPEPRPSATAAPAPDASVAPPPSSAPAAGRTSLTLLQTSDLHTNLFPWDFFKDAEDTTIGLSLVATRIHEERAKNACSLLIDSGDTIQGTPLGTYYALEDNAPVHPMAMAMNLLAYDAMAIGNHEFNYGLDVLAKFKQEVKFPLLAANVRKQADGSAAFGESIVKEVCGVKVAILGLVTPGVTTWERPENIPGLVFESPVAWASRLVPELKKRADVVVISIHSGPDKAPILAPGQKLDDPASWGVWLSDYADATKWTDRAGLPDENVAVQVGQVAGVDVVLSGHTHTPIPKMVIPNTGAVLVQPSYWGKYLGKVTLDLARDGAMPWSVVAKDATLLPVTGAAEAPEIKALRTPYFDATHTYVNRPVGKTQDAFPGGFQARVVDSPLSDLINEVQKWAAKSHAGIDVDLSLAAIFANNDGLPKGDVRLKDAFSIYIYDNTLYVVEVTGKLLRDALEQDATYFAKLDPQALPETVDACKATTPAVADYNWDLYSDIEYTIDTTREPGHRVTALRFKGHDVTDTETFKVAVNNYRGGGGGFPQFKAAKVLWRGADGIRDYVAQYIQAMSRTPEMSLDPIAINQCNFTLLPNLYTKYYPASSAKCAH